MRNTSLQARWQAFSTDTNNIPALLHHTQNLTHSPFGLTDEGRLDFRGIRLEGDPMPAGSGYFHHAQALPQLVDADFSDARWLGFDVHGTQLRNVLFQRTQFVGDTRFFGAQLSHCAFEACTWRNVHFTRSVLAHTRFTGLKRSSDVHFNVDLIDGCLFEGQLKGTHFGASPIRNTRFEGSLHDCAFYGNPEVVVIDAERGLYGAVAPEQVRNRMAGVDWSQASLTRCTITNYCHLDLVVPPPIANNLVLHATQPFCDTASALLQTAFAGHAMADKAQMWLRTFYKPDVRQLHRVASPKDGWFKHAEADQLFYDTLVRAAQATATQLT